MLPEKNVDQRNGNFSRTNADLKIAESKNHSVNLSGGRTTIAMNRFGMQISFLVFFLSAVYHHLPAQVPSLYFEKLTTQNGLSNNKVNCILQDSRGFIWFGTDDGLNRYDGNNFTIFRNTPGVRYSISGNMIMDLFEDKDHILWIATADGGLTKYDYRLSPRKQFVQYKHMPADTNSIPVNVLNALIEDPLGNLWIATSGGGILKFDKKAQTFSRGNLGRTSTCLDLEFDGEGMIWVGRQGGGIMKINPRTNEFTMDERYHNLYDTKLPHITITALYADEEKNMWFGSWDKILYRYNKKKQVEEVFHKDSSPWSFMNDEIPVSGRINYITYGWVEDIRAFMSIIRNLIDFIIINTIHRVKELLPIIRLTAFIQTGQEWFGSALIKE